MIYTLSILIYTDLSNGRRIVLAVTQHDHYYTGKQDEELNEEQTRDHVYEGLQEVGYNVPQEQIVIVSGEKYSWGSHIVL